MGIEGVRNSDDLERMVFCVRENSTDTSGKPYLNVHSRYFTYTLDDYFCRQLLQDFDLEDIANGDKAAFDQALADFEAQRGFTPSLAPSAVPVLYVIGFKHLSLPQLLRLGVKPYTFEITNDLEINDSLEFLVDSHLDSVAETMPDTDYYLVRELSLRGESLKQTNVRIADLSEYRGHEAPEQQAEYSGEGFIENLTWHQFETADSLRVYISEMYMKPMREARLRGEQERLIELQRGLLSFSAGAPFEPIAKRATAFLAEPGPRRKNKHYRTLLRNLTRTYSWMIPAVMEARYEAASWMSRRASSLERMLQMGPARFELATSSV